MTAVALSGGVIRFYASGPEWHVNSTHAAPGIDTSKLSINSSGDLVISLLPSGPVVAIVCAPDETLTSRGVSAGGSGGKDEVRVRFHREGYGPLDLNVDYDLIEGDLANLWFAVSHITAAPTVEEIADLYREVSELKADISKMWAIIREPVPPECLENCYES